MISIKRFMVNGDPEALETYQRMSLLLLQAVGLHAVEGDKADYDCFRAEIADLQSRLEHDPGSANALAATQKAIKALEGHNRRASLFIGAKCGELQAIAGMLTQAMLQISTMSESSIARLQELQKRIESLAMIDDVRALKLELSACLETIRSERDRQREDSRRAVTDMKRDLEKARRASPPVSAESLDELTGLPLRADAEIAMQTACQERSHTYAGLFVVDRIQAINSRFGPAVGDQVMVFFLRYLAQSLSPEDRFYRWAPYSFLALLERPDSGEQIRRQIARTMSQRIEHTLEIGARSVALPVTATWIVAPLFEQSSAEAVKKFDNFSLGGHRG